MDANTERKIRARHLLDQIHAKSQAEPLSLLVRVYANELFESGNTAKHASELLRRFIDRNFSLEDLTRLVRGMMLEERLADLLDEID